MVSFLLPYCLVDCEILLDDVLLDAQVVDDEALPFVGVLAHVELQQVVDRVVLGDANLVQADILADEFAELVGRNLAEALEARDLGIGAAASDGFCRSSSE